MLINESYNPDVLSCLANLSSDEVFTPPDVANQVLNLLPEELWSNPQAKFLDPCSKSGVFLREIAKRLNIGLEPLIPNQQDRINHIFREQLFGIGITSITALLARRSVYCSKAADGRYSVVEGFGTMQGNIVFDRTEHVWTSGKCKYCGASESEYSRTSDFESHAYQFIHTDNPRKIFNMKFDVIIGNPPYQLSDGGHGKSAMPIYDRFVRQAKKLEPNFISMIIPARWFGGGKGLSEFRSEMLNDDQMRVIVDIEDSKDIFPGVDVAGGICYFLWERNSRGDCTIINMRGTSSVKSVRPLNEFATLIRQGEAVSIVRKIQAKGDPHLADKVSSARPFGLRTYIKPAKSGDLKLRWHSGWGPYSRDDVPWGHEMIDRWKVTTSKVSYDHAGMPDKNDMRRVLSRVEILPPGTICTETFLVVECFDTEVQAERMADYLKLPLIRFLISQLVYSQDIFKSKFVFVPDPVMTGAWTESEMIARYGFTEDEMVFVQSKIRPMV